MYANTQNTQATAERGVPRTHIAPPVDGGSLGIYTKSLVAPSKRVHDFILQDQSCKLLPKHRVCNCLKKRIDKDKNRTVKYNVDRKNLTGRMSNAVHLYGFVLFVLNKLQRADVQSFLLLLNVGKRNFRRLPASYSYFLAFS